jgi:twitching motility protein PilT
VLEILKSTLRTRDYMEGGEGEGKTLLDAMRDSEMDGMQYFDGELEKLVRQGIITSSTALLYATNAGNLRVLMADVLAEESEEEDGALVHY